MYIHNFIFHKIMKGLFDLWHFKHQIIAIFVQVLLLNIHISAWEGKRH